MKYSVTQLWMNFTEEIILSEEEFNKLKIARSKVLFLAGFEEKYMMLLENFEDLEQDILHISLQQMIYVDFNLPVFIENLRLLNRRLANLLTVCRLYKDHTAHGISSIYGKHSKQYSHYEKLHAFHYDHNLGYRSMEALRNFLQHRSLIIDRVSHQLERIDEGKSVVHTGQVCVNIQKLREEGDIKKKILTDLETLADSDGMIDIRPLIREYVSSIGVAHVELREMFGDDASVCDNLLLGYIDRLNEATSLTSNSAHVVIADNDMKIDSFAIVKDFVDRRLRLVSRTKRVTHYPSHYISSK